MIERKLIIRTMLGLALVLVLGGGSYLRLTHIEHPILWGETMGTTYRVTITGKVNRKALNQLHRHIEEELSQINRQMSTWDPTSEISHFNALKSTEPFEISEAFSRVVKRALKLSKSTGGAFDPTLQPLLNLWGFGSEGEKCKIPSDIEISKAKSKTGWQKVAVTNSLHLQKTDSELSFALGAITKGYGVDVIARTLNEAGYENWFVEIGGEVVVQGSNPKGAPWRIGVEYPTSNFMDNQLKGILNMSKGAAATSGDYRNYIQEDGVIYSHILDPRSGRSVLSKTASVTVIASNCMDADGAATALFVMGPNEGLAWVEQQPDIEAMFLIKSPTHEISEIFSSGFIASSGYTTSD